MKQKEHLSPNPPYNMKRTYVNKVMTCPECGREEWLNRGKCQTCGYKFHLRVIGGDQAEEYEKKGSSSLIHYEWIALGIGLSVLTWLLLSNWHVLWQVYQWNA